MKRLALSFVAMLFAAGLLRAEDKVVKEDWDWAAAMIKVVKKGKDNKEGVVLSLGDSITYANQSTRWAKGQNGATPEDKAVLKWSHAGERNDQDGWHLAAVDCPGNRSETAASGVRTDQYIQGGKGGLPPLKAILEKYKPQVAFILLGANDALGGRKPEDVLKNMTTIVDTILANGTIPVLQTTAPFADDNKTALVRQYNELFLKMAKEKKIPIVDLFGEFMTRAPGGAYKTALLSDGTHFSYGISDGPPTEDNLKKCGYLLRCWLSVQKLKDIKKDVIDKAR